MVERNLAQINLWALIKTAEETRASELRKRAEGAATEGKVAATRSYKNLIEHEKSKAQWRKIKYYLNMGDAEPLTRLLVEEEGTQKVLTEGEEIQTAIIEQNITHFSEAENTPLGKGTYLHKVIGPHGTSEFCDRVLDGGLGEADKEAIHYVEACELLQHMQKKKQQITPRSPYQWVTDTIDDLFVPSDSPEDSDTDSNTESEPETSDPEESWEDPPDQ